MTAGIEWSKTSKYGTVEKTKNDYVSMDRIPELVVRPEHDQAAPRDAEGVEHLFGRLPPHGDVFQLFPFGYEKVSGIWIESFARRSCLKLFLKD